MSTRWSPELIQRMRDEADEGLTSKEASALLKVPHASAKLYARKNGIEFDVRPERVEELPPDAEEAAKRELRRQITLAKEEARTSPPYEGWRL